MLHNTSQAMHYTMFTVLSRNFSNVVIGKNDQYQAAWYVAQKSVIPAFKRQPCTNTVEIADAVKRPAAGRHPVIPNLKPGYALGNAF